MLNNLLNFIQEKCPNSVPLIISIRGSHAYGTSIPTSDIDYYGIFVQNLDDILGNGYKEQINDEKNDIVFYEVKRFLELLSSANPNILELISDPEDCILYKNDIFDEILIHKDKFITKMCVKSFGGYASEQIKKAKGQDKKQNWEHDKVVRKNPIDFCYFHNHEQSINLVKYLNLKNINQKYCGLSKVSNSKDVYALYYDRFSELMPRLSKFIGKQKGFHGISFEDSNDLRLSSIPKGSKFI